MTKIYLNSVKRAILFYKKYGFTKQDELCDNLCLMTKSINKIYDGQKGKQTKKSRKVKKRQNGV
jgi:hypothetical protein